jgi:hypothetical protein
MSNVAASPNVSGVSSSPAQHMGAGHFFGAIHGAREQCGAIFTDVRHFSPRKLPRHSHELAFSPWCSTAITASAAAAVKVSTLHLL